MARFYHEAPCDPAPLRAPFVPRDVCYPCSAMAAVCDICGKKPFFGKRVSHSHRRTNRRWDPNVQRVRAVVNGSPAARGDFRRTTTVVPEGEGVTRFSVRVDIRDMNSGEFRAAAQTLSTVFARYEELEGGS